VKCRISLALDPHRVVAPRRHSFGYASSSRLALRADGNAIYRHFTCDTTLAAKVEQMANRNFVLKASTA
jgi:hypothetical protein